MGYYYKYESQIDFFLSVINQFESNNYQFIHLLIVVLIFRELNH